MRFISGLLGNTENFILSFHQYRPISYEPHLMLIRRTYIIDISKWILSFKVVFIFACTQSKIILIYQSRIDLPFVIVLESKLSIAYNLSIFRNSFWSFYWTLWTASTTSSSTASDRMKSTNNFNKVMLKRWTECYGTHGLSKRYREH